MKILPGMISDPGWPGERCALCARPIGGDGSDPGMRTCEDSNQQHMTLERIPPERRDRFFLTSVWTNATQAHDNLLDAIDWMTTPRAGGLTPVQMLRAGRGLETLEAQFAEFPHLVRIAEAAERGLAALRSAAA
jgi:hypothetical protein